MSRYFKDSIRWCVKPDGTKVLQVLTVKRETRKWFSPGQYFYDDVWVDVPEVHRGKEEMHE